MLARESSRLDWRVLREIHGQMGLRLAVEVT